MVSYNTGSSYPILNRRKTSLGDKSPGDLLDWSNVNPESSGSNRRYAIRAVVKKGMSISHRVMDKLLKKRGGGNKTKLGEIPICGRNTYTNYEVSHRLFCHVRTDQHDQSLESLIY